jgi:hypothetical protein
LGEEQLIVGKFSEKGVKNRCIRERFAHLESFHVKGGGDLTEMG